MSSILDQDVAAFETHRRALTGLAYRMLGSRAEAEDIVQDAYLRWHAADRTAIEEPRRYLGTVVTRLCLDRMKSARARRELYVGQWLPEPVVDEAFEDDTAGDLAHDISVAMMLLLERLSHLKLEPNPALLEHAVERAESLQNRIADRITAFAGSMRFVYIHLLWFGAWIGFGVEEYPYGLLTMIVSLEAIFLSTFVMISQNRADARRQVVADLQWQTVREEDKQNQQLLDLSTQILELTKAIHNYTTSRSDARS